MGNLQGSESKQPKTGKSSGKGKNLMKNKNKGGKENKLSKKLDNETNSRLQEPRENTIICDSFNEKETASDTPAIEVSTLPTQLGSDNSKTLAGGSRSTNREVLALQGGQNNALLETLDDKNNLVFESWKQVNMLTDSKKGASSLKKDVVSPSKESSSESVFTDPLTPVGFAAEINQCYYSEESVNVQSEETKHYSTNIKAISRQENRKIRREKLGKLSISKVSCISSDDNLDEIVNNTNILCLSHIMPDTCMESFMSATSNLEVNHQDAGMESPITMSSEKAKTPNNNNGVTMDTDVKSFKLDSENQNSGGDMGNFVPSITKKESIELKYEKETSDTKMKIATPVTSFTLSRHKKVDLQPSRVSEECLLQDKSRQHRRHASVSDGPPVGGDSNVLRKVASLTMDRVSLEAKISKPKFVPEKLDFQMYEKFEGQMLVNWFMSAFSEDHYLRSMLSGQDLRLLGVQYCTHLLAAGVLRQIPDKDAPSDNIFRPDLMYYWTHLEAPSSVPITPGRLSQLAWPPAQDIPHNQKPPDPQTPTRKKLAGHVDKTDNSVVQSRNEEENTVLNEAINLRLKPFDQEISPVLDKNIDNKEVFKYVQRICELEDLVKCLIKELDRYKTLAGIQSLTENALRDFDSPMSNEKNGANKFQWNSCDTEKMDDEKFGKIERAEPFFNNDDSSGPCEMLSSQNLMKSYDELCVSSTEKNKKRPTKGSSVSPSPPPMPETDAETNYPSLPPPPGPEELKSCANFSGKKISSPRTSTKSSLPNGVTSPPRSLGIKKDYDISPKTSPRINQSVKQSRLSPKKTVSSPTTKTLGTSPAQSPLKTRSSSHSPLSDKTSPLSKRSPPRMFGKSSKQTSPSTPTTLLKSSSSDRVTSILQESPTKRVTSPRKTSLTEASPSTTSPMSSNKLSPSLSDKNLSSRTFPQSASTIQQSTSVKTDTSTSAAACVSPPVSDLKSSTALENKISPPPPPMPGVDPPSPPPMPRMGPPPPPPMPGMGPPPPPPMPGMGPPPPPPMPGMGLPPPPPMPGMGPPPPPPMPGMGPPPPPPMPGMGPPPPPPMPGMGPPPPPPMPGMGPPPPPMPGMGPPPPPMPGMGPPPPPISGMGPPPPPSGLGPMPFPAPPAGGWDPNRAHLRKKPLNPPMPMKPLYWTRILAPVALSPIATPEEEDPNNIVKPLWAEIDETQLPNIDEFTDLFSRQVITRKPTNKKKVDKPSKVQAAKILDGKRFQSVGILAQSLQVDFSEIENAVYNFDTTTVNLDALQQIYQAKATDEELQKIKDHIQNCPDIPLDKPETFLLELSEIQSLTERISCFTFQAEFDDSIRTITSKLDNIWRVCEFLITNDSLKMLFSIILTLGNFMNGGNMQRGQADGFGLEILSKLLDVKSKDSSVTLLHFIVKTYMNQTEDSTKSPLPIPEPGDISRASCVLFEDIKQDLDSLQKKFDGCTKKTEKVINESIKENLQPFKDKMTAFLETAGKQLSTEIVHLSDCQNKFIATMKFYQYKPKSGTLSDCSPKEFFDLWSQFCADFKDIWKKEEQKRIQELSKKVKTSKKERTSEIQKVKKKEGGLKAKIEKLRKS